MPDISMCYGGDCPLKDGCYRYRAKPNEFRQSYMSEPPFDSWRKPENAYCQYYWPVNKASTPLQDSTG